MGLDGPRRAVYLRSMFESAKASELIDEWKRHEARIVEIKKALAGVLGVSPSVVVRIPAPTPPSQLELTEDDQEGHASVASGTKARATIEAIQSVGGKAKARQVHEALLAQGLVTDGPKGMKSIRSYFSFLKRKEYITEVKGNRGMWALTPKATAVLGGAP